MAVYRSSAGLVGDASGVDHVTSFLLTCMEGDIWRQNEAADVDLYHTVAMVRVKDSCSVGMLGEGTDLELPIDVDDLNFKLLEPGTRLGYTRKGCADCVSVHTDDASLGRSETWRSREPMAPRTASTACLRKSRQNARSTTFSWKRRSAATSISRVG